MANSWQGEFPWQNLKTDGYDGHVAGGLVPAERLRALRRLRERLGVDDRFLRRAAEPRSRSCCAPARPHRRGAIPRRVIKGGSHLCAANYCLRYRPAARQAEQVDTSTGHIGFRCIVRTP